MKKGALMAIGVAAALTVTAASPLLAQSRMGWTAYGTGEFDTNDVIYLLAGAAFSPIRAGWAPVVGAQAHWLRFPSTAGDVDVSGIQPYVGMQNNYGTGLLAFRVGYQFEGEGATASTAPVPQNVGDGAVVTGQLEHWGTGRGLGSQLLGTYNFGSETFWGRARASVGLAEMQPGAVRLGGEIAYLAAPNFTSTSIGPVLEWQTGRGFNLGFAVGRRIQDGGNATYFRIDFAAFPR